MDGANGDDEGDVNLGDGGKDDGLNVQKNSASEEMNEIGEAEFRGHYSMNMDQRILSKEKYIKSERHNQERCTTKTRDRLLNVELPYALSKIAKLLEQLHMEIEPTYENGLSGASQLLTPPTEAGNGQVSNVENDDALVSKSLMHASSRVSQEGKGIVKHMPKSFKFIKGKSAEDSAPKTATVDSLGARGLVMQHKHSSKSTSSSPSNLAGSNSRSSKRCMHVEYGSAPSSAAPSRSFTPHNGTWMDVSLCMDGFLIPQAKIDLRTQKQTKSTVVRKAGGNYHNFRTEISKSPWVLDQLRLVHQIAQSQLARVEEWLASLGENGDLNSLFTAQESLHGLVIDLVRARNALTSPSPKAFPQSLQSPTLNANCAFHPAPGPEILLDFAIHLDELVVSGYEVRHLQNSRASSITSSSWVDAQNYCNKTFRFEENDTSVEVIDHVQVCFKVHSLQWVLESIYETYNVAYRMLRKFESLNRHEIARLRTSGVAGDLQKASAALERFRKLPNLPSIVLSNFTR